MAVTVVRRRPSSSASTSATQALAQLLEQVHPLLKQIDRLKALQRAGETPSYGQVEALFDQAANVRVSLVRTSLGRDGQAAPWPTTPPPMERTARQLVRLLVQQLLLELAPGKDSL